MTSFAGIIQGYGPKAFPPDWRKIGYTETPQTILDGFEYAKTIFDNWNPPTSLQNYFRDDSDLKFFPNVDLTGHTNYADMFNNAALEYSEPLTIGDGTNTVVNASAIFRNAAFIEDIKLTSSEPTQAINIQNAFNTCSKVKKIELNLKASGSLQGTFSDCSQLERVDGNIDLSGITSLRQAFYHCYKLVYFPSVTTTALTDCYRVFQGCASLRSAPSFDLSHVTNLQQMFWDCTALEDLPFMNIPAATNLTGMFQGTGSNLSENSRRFILKMCISASSYSGTKTLAALGFNSSMYTAASWEALPEYSEFTTEGWSIGYT